MRLDCSDINNNGQQLQSSTSFPALDQEILHQSPPQHSLTTCQYRSSPSMICDTCALRSNRTGKERASVANFLRLLRLPEAVQHSVEAGELSFGHARTLLALETPEQILAAAQKVRVLAMSVRQCSRAGRAAR